MAIFGAEVACFKRQVQVSDSADYVEIEGVRVSRQIVGSGPPLVLLHGHGGTGLEWQSSIPVMAQHFRVYAPFMPGHGDSGPIAKYSLEAACRLLLAVLDAEDLNKVALAGLSMGGLIALSMAIDYPERVSKLVLVGSAGLGPEVNLGVRLLTLPVLGELVCDFLFPKYHVHLARLAQLAGLKVPKALSEAGAWRFNGSLARLLRVGIDMRGQKHWTQIKDQLANLNIPTLIIWGERDELFPISQAKAAHRIIPRSRLRVLQGAGHVPSRTHLEELNSIMLEFLLTDDMS